MNTILRRGDKGEPVLVLQQLLVRNQIPVSFDGIFGPLTEDAVKFFQKQNGLVVDGIAGPITFSKLDPDWGNLNNRRKSRGDAGFRILAAEIAESYEGVSEKGGDNKGPEIDKWMADLGITWPAPWCMGFVQACYKEACKRCGFADLLKPDTAHCLTLWNACKKKGWTVSNLEGQRGDIAIFDWGGGAGHTGIVSSYKDGVYQLVEGNTDSAGGRDGDKVAIKKRAKYNARLLGFIRVPQPDVVS